MNSELIRQGIVQCLKLEAECKALKESLAESQDHVQSWYDRYMNTRDRAPDAARHRTWVDTIYGNSKATNDDQTMVLGVSVVTKSGPFHISQCSHCHF